MARQRKASRPSGGRGSKEAIEKRRAARQLNTLLTGGAKSSDKVDGRTEKRRRRLIKELKEGRKGQPLKPIDFVTHVDELLDLGETIPSLKKQGVKPRKTEPTREVMEVVRQTQDAYGFRPESWRMLGIQLESAPRSAGRSASGGKKTSRKKKGSKSSRRGR